MEEIDLVSDLPHEILQHMVSYLPLKDAVRASSISTLWKKSVLVPLQVNLKEKEVQEKLGMFLSSFTCHDKLRFCVEKKEEDLIIVLATKGVEKELHLQFFGQDEKQTTCRFFNLNLESSLSMASSSSLKTLHLSSIKPSTTRLVSDFFAKNCPLLQSLKLEKCVGLRKLDEQVGNSLQSLTVLDCPDIVRIIISSPNLKSFSYRGVLPRIELKSASELVDVTLDLRDGLGHNQFHCEEGVCLLASLKEVETLTISSWFLEWMCRGGVIFKQLEFQLNKLKELHLMDRSKRDSLACFLNICPLLQKLFVQMDHQNKSDNIGPCPYFHEYWHEPHLWMDYEMVKSNTSELKHLRELVLEGFMGEEDEVLLMELLLDKAVGLQSMIVT
ncbi:hypothetical protein UlMin_005977 [Ulmus minor]